MSDDFETELRTNIASMAEKSKARIAEAETEATKHKPEWVYWVNYALVRLDDAVVLSCDIDPAWHGNRTDILLVCKRKSIAESHIASGALKVGAPLPLHAKTGYVGDCLVALSDFRKWGESLTATSPRFE